MKQTAKRILSIVLSLLMLISVMSVYTFAENNYVADDEYYNRIINDSVIVNAEWASYEEGDRVSYVYRGKNIDETFDSNIHFSSIKAAYEHCLEMNVSSPVIILCPGIYTEKLTITGSVTILGANAGINPNIVSDDPATPWSANTERGSETILKGYIDVSRLVNSNIEIVLDGVTLHSGFSYIDAGNKKATSSAVLRNSIISGAGSTSYGITAVTNVFYFASSSSSTNNVKIENVRCTNMKTTSIVGTGVTNLDVSGLFYTNNTSPAIQYGEAPADQNASYVIKDSMFYNNQSVNGVLHFDHSIKDSNSRTDTSLEIYDCVFMDNPEYVPNDKMLGVSPVNYTITSPKNRVNIHDNLFIGAVNYNAPAVGFMYTSAALYNALIDNIKINTNKFIGYPTVNETSSLSDQTVFSYTGNYFADFNGAQCDPIYPSSASKKNIAIDYFWLDSDMTVPSEIFHLTSTGIAGSDIDYIDKTIKATIDYGQKSTVNLVASDSSVKFVLYDNTMTEKVTEIDSKELISGNGKNTFYAVGTSPKTDYVFVYTVVLTTYNPDLAYEFDLKNTYLLAPDVASLPAGSAYYSSWDSMEYKFTVGVNAFSSAEEIIALCDTVPTIIMPAGTYNQQITLTGSAVLLGAKHGINPNIPNFNDPEMEWEKNPERTQSDQESIIENCVIGIASSTVNATVVVDGFTFGKGSGFFDRGEGVETYTTSIIKNVIIDRAGSGVWYEDGKSSSLNTVFVFGGSGDIYKNNHKDVRLVNLRMVNQGATNIIGDFYETLIMDGVYIANNTTTLHSAEWTHPKGQNFYLEIRNSCFYKNVTSTYYFLVNNNTFDSDQTTSNRLVLDNNIFYNTSTNPYGIFGIRFCGAKDSLRFVNNTFITSTAGSIIPGNVNWFLGASAYNPTTKYTEEELNNIECVNDVVMMFNRFVYCTTMVDMYACKPGTNWNMNYNYFASSYTKSDVSSGVKLKSGYDDYVTCDYYYKDWNLTNLNDAEDSFKTELDYSINGPGTVDYNAKTYTDTVPHNITTYDFGIKLETTQASYGIYSDPGCTVKVAEPVSIAGGENIFYIKLSSYDGSVSDIYRASIAKPLGTDANITRFGTWRVADSAVYACVPVGETEFVIPEITVSNGASYAIYNDSNCTTLFNNYKITGIGVLPAIKYIKVTSEDGITSKVYTLSVIQSTNDQAEISYIKGASKISDTEFKAEIPANISSFDLIAEYSDNAVITVYDNGQAIKASALGIYTIGNISNTKTVDIVVSSLSGAEKTFKLTIVKDTSSCNVTSIFGMINNGDNDLVFETIIDGISFKVIPYLENVNGTYAVYADRNCTVPCNNDTVSMTAATTYAYLKVTSADNTSSKVYTLKIYTSSSDFSGNASADENAYEVANATQTAEGVYYIDAEDNLSSYDFNINLLESAYSYTTYRLYSDEQCTTNIGAEVAVGTPCTVTVVSKYTNVYAKVWVKKLADGAETPTVVKTDIIKITINSNRPKAVYNDAATISSWAIDQVNFLNDNGYGYFQGDNGNFKPKDSITRFEVAAIAIRVLGIDQTIYSSVITSYTDNIPNWAKDYVAACYKLGIMTGVTNTTFDGSKSTTRQEFAKIIVNTVAIARGDAEEGLTLYNNNQAEIDAAYNTYNFADEANISAWAKPYVRLAVVKYGLMSGSNDYGTLNINPKNNVTRQEVAVILANYNGYSK